MMWAIMAAMTVVAVAFLVVPLVWKRGGATTARGDHDLAVYKDQLAEVGRDVERGLLTPQQAEGARVEIERRMLSAADAKAEPVAKASGPTRLAIAAIAVAVPLGSVGVYLSLGSPDLPGQPYAERQAGDDRIAGLVDTLAARMEAMPDNAQGWLLLGRSSQALGRHDQAARALSKAIALGVTDVDTLSNLGEALTAAADGSVTADARAAFLRAYRADPTDPRSSFYLGLAALEAGRPDRAIAIWRALEQASPAGAPWLDTLRERIRDAAVEARLDAQAVPPLDPATVWTPEIH